MLQYRGKKDWACYHDKNRGVHVIPRNDDVEHELTDDCVCGAEVEPVERDNGSYGWLYIHASLDGRELREQLGET